MQTACSCGGGGKKRELSTEKWTRHCSDYVPLSFLFSSSTRKKKSQVPGKSVGKGARESPKKSIGLIFLNSHGSWGEKQRVCWLRPIHSHRSGGVEKLVIKVEKRGGGVVSVVR